jgi:hypothetical protein
LSPAGGTSCNIKIIGEFRVGCGAESSKELTFLHPLQIDIVDIGPEEEWRGVQSSRNRRSAEVTAAVGELIIKKVSFD